MNRNIMYRPKYNFLIIVLTILACGNGCKSDADFLTETPKTFYTLNNAFSTSSQVDAAIVSCYQLVRLMNITDGQSTFVLKGKGTDVMDASLLNITTSFSDYSRIDPDRDEYYNIYRNLYRLVSRANTAIYAANLEHIAWNSEQDKLYALAQAKFFRAYAYRMLGELFGGVPIVEDIITEAKLDFVRSTRIETYQFAINDLESVMNDLPESTTSPGRIVKGAAQHYLSQLYLGLGIEMEMQGQNGSEKYDRSISYANQVIAGGRYGLMTERFGRRKDRNPGDVWWDLWQEGNINYEDGNKECIWAFQIDYQSHLSEDPQSYLGYPRDYMPVLVWVAGFEGIVERGGRGVATVTHTHYVRDSIWAGPVSTGDIRNAEHNIQRTFRYNAPGFPQFGEVIPYTVLYQDDNFRSAIFPIFHKLSTDEWKEAPGNPYSKLFRDEYAIRLPETILLRAEAFYRQGNLQNAANDINLIRARAKTDYMVAPNEVNIDFILDERARELYVEEQRWNTLLRMGGTVAVDRIRKYAFWPTTKATLNFNFNLWPIPQRVIDSNLGAVMEQNPGWN